MVSKVASILALATAVLAHPQRHHRFHYGTGTGGGFGFAKPTGATFPNGTAQTNGTDFGGSPVESPVMPVKTVTVIPIPLESSTGDAADDFSSLSVANASDTTVTPAGGSSTSCSISTTSTITTTSVQFVTVTAGANLAESGDSGENVTIPSGSALSSDASSSSPEDLSDSTSVSLVGGTPTAGAFFGRPSTRAGSSGPAFQPSSVVESATPTTFATIAGSPPASSSDANATASSPSSPSSSTASTDGSTSGKRGLSYNDASLTNAFAGKGISWAYNWGSGPDGAIVSGAEYVPMLWGSSSVSGWSSAVQSAISSGSEHVLSFNEPDLSSQSNIDPSTAAQLHIENVAPLSGQVSIGSPAVTNGAGSNPPMGTTWLQQFFDACAGQCNIDFVTFHWYDSASNVDYFKSHVQDVIDTAAKNGVSKVWLTEFGASGSDSDVASFLNDVIPWLDSQAAVERYAYFMCSDGLLVSGNSISSPIGEAYLS
ncbi:uncharacterized protein Z518_07151 [Rhinocladiella mackenziei CBS 650.93]|uniref:Rhinocladiella mackenziei CBS 650.93 unplaced genomic scaffold supercont1.5, whole genome shotgun sequence n=1 Tax=Rhinocladiella mackenziei CBS 650.93 TaxID=1442369 RepID=A0A0D2GZI2_9EURO|nr:uncharacterized protein Z518_07151 [Rhinocladiella mackenziei CBS 650.93]KIX03598.1 hypothetical protein Z518_07151 [Rhinocladiella mackenziei CBS 650.93]